ncbi:UNVERIFIED_CONTAM: hypothetical protein GTU68_064262 [Idotea baltica]|nr:hypothetical protein [Idotea baltica]
MVGMHGNYGPNKLTNECDVLIAIGMRFDDRVTGNLATYAKQAKVVHFEIDPAEIDKNVKTDVAVLGDVKNTLAKILPKINKNSHSEWMQEFKDYMDIEYDKVIKSDLYPEKDGLTMGEVIKQINEASNGDAIIVSDVGQHQMITCRYAKFNKSKSNVTSGGLGTMGFALPAAIGAKMGQPDREVVAIIGDGSYQMTIQELGTIYQTNVPVKIVVLNNEFLGMVHYMEDIQKFTFSVYTENNIGILNRLSAIFLKRHFNIESMTVSKSEIDDVHRFIFVVNITKAQSDKLIGQLEKQIEVIRAYSHTEDEIIYQETAMFKISSKHLYDEDIQNRLKFRRANIVAITPNYFVIEATGLKEEIDNMHDKLKPFGLLQFVRSGRISISRPKMAISELLQEYN